MKKEEAGVDLNGEKIMKCGFKIGGGIDQNYMKSPQGYSDNVSEFVGHGWCVWNRRIISPDNYK